jgi:hypothetical protein
MAKTIQKASAEWARYQKATVADYTRHRLIGLSVGEPGSRKTSFWLEAPGPIVVFSMDRGLEGVIDRILRDSPDKDVYVKEYDWFPSEEAFTMEDAQAIREELTADHEHAVAHARTIIWDKEGDIWSLFRYAEFGNNDGKINGTPLNYPALNQRYRRLINLAKSTSVNFGCIEGMKDEWGKSVNKKTGAQGAAATGNRIRVGFNELDGLVHLQLTHTGLSPADWGIAVGKSRGPGGHAVAGQNIGNCTFQEFSCLVFPDSDISEWE